MTMNNLVFEGREITLILKNQLRDTVTLEGDFLISGREVALILGYKNPNDALLRHIDTEDRYHIRNAMIKSDAEGIRKLNNAGESFINESGLYSLIFNSDLTSAKRFKRWVTAEVLPQIRVYGSYNYINKVSMPMSNKVEVDEQKIKLIIQKLALENMLSHKTDKVKEIVTYLRAYGITKSTASEMALRCIKYNIQPESVLEDYNKQQKELQQTAYTGKIKLNIAYLVKLGYTQQDAWNKFAEVASNATGIDLKTIKTELYRKNIKTTYCNLVKEYNIQKESLTAFNRFLTQEKKKVNRLKVSNNS